MQLERFKHVGIALTIALIAAAGTASSAEPTCSPLDASTPRTLVLALDGVPLRTIRAAQERGAFTGWPEPQPLVSTFPSITNVAFTAILEPFGATPAGGYEVQHFDRERNEIVGGTPFGYHERLYAWRDAFDVTSRTFKSKIKTYTQPRDASLDEFEEAAELLFTSGQELVLAHIGAVDALIHLRGDDASLKLVLELDRRVRLLKHEHLIATGRPLRVVLLSDHGNSAMKIHKAEGLKKSLRKGGLRVVEHLEAPGDVVAPTFGIVSYGALFTFAENAATAGSALASNRSVDLAAWLAGPAEMAVVSGTERAAVRFRQDAAAGGWSIAYDASAGDPLGYRPQLEDLAARGRLSRDGYASADDWFRATAASNYPDGLRRLIQSLTGTWVENYATVVFSLENGYGWGWTAAHVSSKLSGGKLEGTHGALDAVASLGFFLADDPALQPSFAVRSDQALAPLAGARDCFLAVGGEHDPHGGHHPSGM